MTKILAGKTVLVTGASRNLGRGIAERLAASGALVALNYAKNDKAAHDTLAGIEAKGGKAFLLKQELGPNGTCEALAETLKAELTKRTGDPGLDILINNVGGGDFASIHTTTYEIFDRTVSNNLRVPFFLTKALLPVLRQGGRVVNLSSTASRIAVAEVIAYSMCKAAVEMFTRCMAKELGPRGITVNAVLPGYNETESNAAVFNDPELRKQAEAATALGRFGTKEDIADVVHALVSPDMGWVTSSMIDASGGVRL